MAGAGSPGRGPGARGAGDQPTFDRRVIALGLGLAVVVAVSVRRLVGLDPTASMAVALVVGLGVLFVVLVGGSVALD